MFDTSFPGLLLAPHDPVNIAFSVAPTKRGPDMVTLLDGLRTFVLDFRHLGHIGLEWFEHDCRPEAHNRP